jgi:PAS domain S-box-containing protein
MTFDVNVTAQVLARRELAEREERIQGLLCRRDAGIAQALLNGRIVMTDARHRMLFGRSEADLNRAYVEDLVRENESDNIERLRELVEEGTTFATKAQRAIADGSTVWLHNTFSRIEDHDGRPRGVIAVTVAAAGP